MSRKAGNGIFPSSLPCRTDEGGLAISLINKTGAASVKGTLVRSDLGVDEAVVTCAAGEPDTIGIIYEDGVADGDAVLVVIYGIAEVLLEDSTASTRGYWAAISTSQNGRADMSAAAPPGGGIPEADRHFEEIGHCVESKGAGTDVLAKCIIHFN